ARLARDGAALLVEALGLLETGRAPRVVQDSSRATFAPKVAREEAWISWSDPAAKIVNQVRAFDPWPVARTRRDGAPLEIWRAAALPDRGPEAPGTVVGAGREGPVVAAGDGGVRIIEAQVAQEILRRNGLSEVEIERTDGVLSDHYDPRTRTLSLSSDVHDGVSVASAGVAAHETGHAVQHARDYAPLALRSAMVPTAQFGSWLAWPLFAIGFFIHSGVMIQLGILIFSATVAFTIVTLPVEFDASAR